MIEITNLRTKLNFIKTISFWLLFIFFFILLEKTTQRATFQGHLMFYLSIKFDKTCMKIMVLHLTTPLCGFSGRLTPQWSWHQPKKTNSSSLQLPNLTNHDDNFEPTNGILLVRIKGQDLALIKTKCLSSTPYIWDWIPCPEHEEIAGQSWEKISLSLVFSAIIIFILSPRHLFSHHNLRTIVNNYNTTSSINSSPRRQQEPP